MNQGLQQQIQKVGDNVTTIKNSSLDSLKADVAKLGSRASEAENRTSHLEDENMRLVNKSQTMEVKITQLQARIEYQENYSRRNNMCIKGVPEEMEKGQSMDESVKDLLQCLFADTSEDPGGMIIERAHRTPTTRFPPDRRNTDPRPWQYW